MTVTSWDPGSGRPARNRRRPFVEYADGSDLWVVRSTFAYLGSDRSSAYGVIWRRATGGATDSVFHHNFFGAYTYQAHGLQFRGNVFRDNDVYGLDPHTASTRLVVEHNQAFRNKVHGIVFSEDVTDGVVRANRAYANGDNGIVIDERSDRNTVSGNLVEGNGATGSCSWLVGQPGARQHRPPQPGRHPGQPAQRRQPGAAQPGQRQPHRHRALRRRLRRPPARQPGERLGGEGHRARGPGGDQPRRPGHRVAGRRRGPGPGPSPRDNRGRGRPGIVVTDRGMPPSTTPPCAPPPPGSRSARAGWSASAPPRSSRRPPCRGRRPGRCWPTGSPSLPARSPGWPWSVSPTWWWRSPSSSCT